MFCLIELFNLKLKIILIIKQKQVCFIIFVLLINIKIDQYLKASTIINEGYQTSYHKNKELKLILLITRHRSFIKEVKWP